MSTIPYDTVLNRVRRRFVHEPDILRRLRAETSSRPNSQMILDPEGGAVLAFLARAIQPKRTLDIGVFTGYSALAIALNAPDARITALYVDADVTETARRYWREAGVADRIDLRIGPALESLGTLIADGNENGFDFAFIDADKPNYGDYYERALTLLRPGGVMALDNILWAVLAESPDDISDDARTLDELTERMSRDDRVTMAVLPVGSGMTIATKNG
ncbi:MAG: class I SAM-dependent methyltransferase [Actinobacteria bacterium]|nr:class I SAM-dependent methyltransferase [Actinomycetota bacterium]